MAQSPAACSDPGRRYELFHRDFNEFVKLLAAGLQGLGETAARPKGDEEVTALMRSVEPVTWAPTTFRRVRERLPVAVAALARWPLIAVFSALDAYLDGVDALLTGTGGSKPLDKDEVKAAGSRLNLFMQILGSHLQPESSEALVLDLFRMIRDCIAHRDGVASDALTEFVRSPSLAAAWAALGHTSRTARIPSPPALDATGRVELRFSHSILASYAAGRIVTSVDRGLLAHLGDERLVKMAAEALVQEPELAEHKDGKIYTVEAAVCWVLSVRFRSTSMSRLQVEGYLASMRDLRRRVASATGLPLSGHFPKPTTPVQGRARVGKRTRGRRSRGGRAP